MNEIVVNVEAEVNPTEDLEKVKLAVQNIFGAVNFEVESRIWGQLLKVEAIGSASLIKLYNLLRREQILAAARKVFYRGMSEKTVKFYLNKQVAYVGRISFCQETAESPLGPIKVQIFCSSPRELIEWLTQKPAKKGSSSRSR